MASVNLFDLNVGRALEHWQTAQALREIIANALDEQTLSQTPPIRIFKEAERWRVRDFGRGLEARHFIFQENEEKATNAQSIGKFGFGLKDAIAVLHRKGVNVKVRSRFNEITFQWAQKHGFQDLDTLHAAVAGTSDKNFPGTEFIFENLEDYHIEAAKRYFLRYNHERMLETVRDSVRGTLGDILEKSEARAAIYFNGVKVAEEDNFLFSYNIRYITKATRDKLNRERQNVGRDAYKNIVEEIVLNAKSEDVENALAKALRDKATVGAREELRWKKVTLLAVRIQNALQNTLFYQDDERVNYYSIFQEALEENYVAIPIDAGLMREVKKTRDIKGGVIVDMKEYMRRREQNLSFDPLPPEVLTEDERAVFAQTDAILTGIGGRPLNLRTVYIADKIGPPKNGREKGVLSFWDPQDGIIVLHRETLETIEKYAAALLEHVAAARSYAAPGSREYERELTRMLGALYKHALK